MNENKISLNKTSVQSDIKMALDFSEWIDIECIRSGQHV